MKCKCCRAHCRVLCTASEFHFQCTNTGSTGNDGRLPRSACPLSTHSVNKAGLVQAWRIYHPLSGYLFPKDVVLCEYCGQYNNCLFCADSYPPEREEYINRKLVLRTARKLLGHEAQISKGSAASTTAGDQGQTEVVTSTEEDRTQEGIQ